jgi:hypothetical protein
MKRFRRLGCLRRRISALNQIRRHVEGGETMVRKSQVRGPREKKKRTTQKLASPGARVFIITIPY